jgi:hypothetical protein
MTRDEFEKIKEAEKKRLRMQKRLRALKASTERQTRAASLVRKMKHAGASLLRDTQSLVDSLSSEVAKSQARLEVALDDAEDDRDREATPASSASDEDVAAFEEKQSSDARSERARRLVQQFRESVQPTRGTSRGDASPSETQADDAGSTDRSPREDAPDGDASQDDALPDKTIGRMRRPPDDR